MNPEESIERYFQFLADPSTLVDQERVNELRRSIDSTTSLMDRALLISELERAESADPTEVVKGFISHGRRWAEAKGVSSSALRSVGVPAEVLSAAGIDGRRKGNEPRPSGRVGRGRGVTSTEVREHVLSRTAPFTYQQVMVDTGSSLMTVRKAVERLLGEQKVALVGQDAEWAGPGRAPNLYSVC